VGRPYDTISLLTDFGRIDEAVGVLHAIARDMAPHARVIDLNHALEPGDGRGAALSLARAAPYLPEGVIVVSVDAGDARLVAVEVAGGAGIFVGPDNGVLAAAVAIAGGAERAVHLDRGDTHLASPGSIAPARDVLMPVAAALCNGADLTELGSLIDCDGMLPGTIPIPRDGDGDALHCEVLWVDRRGTVQLNAGPDDIAHLGSLVAVRTGDTERVATSVSASSELMPGALGLTVDSHGMIAVVANRRSAAEELGVSTGDQVTLAPSEPGRPTTGAGSPVTLRATRPNR
jgi:S-adenosylmethionine hydrolase